MGASIQAEIDLARPKESNRAALNLVLRWSPTRARWPPAVPDVVLGLLAPCYRDDRVPSNPDFQTLPRHLPV